MEETRNSSGRWSELPMDILRSVLERLSFMDFHRSKIICSNWYLCSKQQSVRPRGGSPLLILFPKDGCVLYNPDEDRVYKPKNPDFSGFRFLANSGKWFLVVDSRSNLYIIDVFSEKKIELPPLESIKGAPFIIDRVGDKYLMKKFDNGRPCRVGARTAQSLRGVLWVNEDKEELEYVVVWRFDIDCHYIGFCKNGYDDYLGTPTHPGMYRKSIHWKSVRKDLEGLVDMVLKRGTLYILSDHCFIRTLDFSGQDGFKDVSDSHIYSMDPPFLIERRTGTKIMSYRENIALTTSGDVLLVCTIVYEDPSTSTRYRIFRLFKRDPNQDPNHYMPVVEVDSLGDEALFLDSGIIVPADKTLGIESNSIYFTNNKYRCLDICVYNLATKTIKRFPCLSELKIKDALWFLPS